MNTFWDNISKFPRFLITVIVGFFLTTLQPIFKLLKGRKKRFFLTVILCLFIAGTYQTLKLMLGIN